MKPSSRSPHTLAPSPSAEKSGAEKSYSPAQPVTEIESSPRTRQQLQDNWQAQDAERKRLAALTALCLMATLTAWAGEATAILPHGVVLALFAVAYFTGGFEATRRALADLRIGTLNIDLLMVLAALGAGSVGQWREGAVLLFLFSLSGTLEGFVLGRTRRAIAALMDLSPDMATVRRDGKELHLPVEEVQVDEIVFVRPGERIPIDGEVLQGRSSVDQSAMTGESAPVDKVPGSPVFAATLNGSGALEVRVTKIASQSTLARIIGLVEEAQSEKAPAERFTDWFGARYTIGVLAAAALAIVLPMVFFAVPFEAAFYRAMTLLVVASPCAVVISIPAAIMAAIAGAARRGVLFKGGAYLEEMARLNAIAFDKTGTLTVGHPQLVNLKAASGQDGDAMLALAASAESTSEHPLAKAVVEAARQKNLALLPAGEARAIVGRGLQAQVGERLVYIGKPDLWIERGLAIPAELQQAASEFSSLGQTTFFVGDEQSVLGVLSIADTLRSSAKPALRELKAQGIAHVTMLTGDNERVAEKIAGELGMGYKAGLLPQNKLDAIKQLKAEYGKVGMVGDGINDAPPLAGADLGISLGGTGTDVALETADVVLMSDDLRHLPYAVALARQTRRIILQNLVFAFGMMAVLIAGTFFASLRLPLAVLGHEGSTVLVILNGLRLLRFKHVSKEAQ